MNKSALGMLWSPMWIMDEPTHLLEGRKREKRVGELRNVAHCKRGLTSWRGGRGRKGVGDGETGKVANQGLIYKRRGEGGGGGEGVEVGKEADADKVKKKKRVGW